MIQSYRRQQIHTHTHTHTHTQRQQQQEEADNKTFKQLKVYPAKMNQKEQRRRWGQNPKQNDPQLTLKLNRPFDPSSLV